MFFYNNHYNEKGKKGMQQSIVCDIVDKDGIAKKRYLPLERGGKQIKLVPDMCSYSAESSRLLLGFQSIKTDKKTKARDDFLGLLDLN